MKLRPWLALYGMCSLIAGVLLVTLVPVLDGAARWFLGGFALYVLGSGIAMIAGSRFSPQLFLLTGLMLLGFSLWTIVNGGWNRSHLFGLLGALITIHGYWVLREDLSRRSG